MTTQHDKVMTYDEELQPIRLREVKWKIKNISITTTLMATKLGRVVTYYE